MRRSCLSALLLCCVPGLVHAQQAAADPAPAPAVAAPAPKPAPAPAPVSPAASAPAPKSDEPAAPKREEAPPPAPAPKAAAAPAAAPAAAAPPRASRPKLTPEEVAAMSGAAALKMAAQGAPKQADDDLASAAQRLLEALLTRDLDGIMTYCRAPFFFEGKQVASAAEIRKRWTAELSSETLERLSLVGIEFYSHDEMVARFGKAPEKLAAWPLKSGTLAVANLSGHPVVVLWRKSARGWEALGFHD